MRNKITRHSASAALEMLPSGVLVVRLMGPLTGDALLHFKREILARHGPDIRAFVADYTGAAIALTGADLDRVLEGEAADSGPGLPAALVVVADQERLFLGHALRMAARGVLRQVFTDHQSALCWSRRHAERLKRRS